MLLLANLFALARADWKFQSCHCSGTDCRFIEIGDDYRGASFREGAVAARRSERTKTIYVVMLMFPTMRTDQRRIWLEHTGLFERTERRFTTLTSPSSRFSERRLRAR